MQTVVVAKRRSGGRTSRRDFDLGKVLATLADGHEIQLCGQRRPAKRANTNFRVDVTPLGRRRLRAALGERVWIEKPIRYFTQAWPTRFSLGDTIRIHVVDDQGLPVPYCGVTILANLHECRIEQRLTRDANRRGLVEFPVFEPMSVSTTVAAPVDGCWTAEVVGAPPRIVCPRIAYPEDRIGWWHRSLGFDTINERQGGGIKIGIIDTGCGDHRALAHVEEIGTYSGGSIYPEALSAGGHGAHVSGIVAARPDLLRGFWGFAPGATVFMACIASDVSQDDIANAVEDLVERNQVDLINISLAAENKSTALNDAIGLAEQSGCLCICAAGNSGDPTLPPRRFRKVMWPARCRKAVAVSAIGSPADVPRGTYAAGCLPGNGGAGYVVADFSALGNDVFCCGPGVGIVSTLSQPLAPSGWADMSGTSMAAPAVCGTLAARLGELPAYRQSPRNSGRTRLARQTLRRMCRSLDLPESNQGWGIPCLSGVLPPKRRSAVRLPPVRKR